mmetsp:Transcript_55228/g.147423  ORF Transcript_55228/g.147423 Transcript_55228/m.147423 type:complete len:226 (-) Transcript_55228:185-862(-)
MELAELAYRVRILLFLHCLHVVRGAPCLPRSSKLLTLGAFHVLHSLQPGQVGCALDSSLANAKNTTSLPLALGIDSRHTWSLGDLARLVRLAERFDGVDPLRLFFHVLRARILTPALPHDIELYAFLTWRLFLRPQPFVIIDRLWSGASSTIDKLFCSVCIRALITVVALTLLIVLAQIISVSTTAFPFSLSLTFATLRPAASRGSPLLWRVGLALVQKGSRGRC